MKNLTPELIATIQAHMKGKKLEKFNESVQVINDSLAKGGWVPRGSVKALSGFYQGCGIRWSTKHESTVEHRQNFELQMALSYGHDTDDLGNAIDRLYAAISTKTGKAVVTEKKFPRSFVEAWIQLSREKSLAFEFLNVCRPLPVVTEIGLSPRVTATLTEMNLEVDLPSIKLAKIDSRMVPGFKRDGTPLLDRRGNRMMVPEYFVAWTPGTAMGMSRFSCGCRCEACGKSIPSGRFVPIEADDKKSGQHIGLWVGQDCASNIFGVKDAGMERV